MIQMARKPQFKTEDQELPRMASQEDPNSTKNIDWKNIDDEIRRRNSPGRDNVEGEWEKIRNLAVSRCGFAPILFVDLLEPFSQQCHESVPDGFRIRLAKMDAGLPGGDGCIATVTFDNNTHVCIAHGKTGYRRGGWFFNSSYQESLGLSSIPFTSRHQLQELVKEHREKMLAMPVKKGTFGWSR